MLYGNKDDNLEDSPLGDYMGSKYETEIGSSNGILYWEEDFKI